MDLRLPPALHADAHKGDGGRVLCVAGRRTMPGAAVLVARAAQRGGAGLVTMACADPELLTILPVAAPEAVLVDLSGHGDAGELLGGDGRAQPHATLLGPGLGLDARAQSLLGRWLSAPRDIPRVLDADGLNLLQGVPERLRDLGPPFVLTPHPGEAARLLGRAIPTDEAGRREAALELSRRSGAVVVLKGAGTLVTDGIQVQANRTGNPGMATAGAGDVLAGILVAYLARSAASGSPRSVFEDALVAVHVHGLAGDLAARRLGRRALVASDLVASLPEAQRELEPPRDRDPDA